MKASDNKRAVKFFFCERLDSLVSNENSRSEQGGAGLSRKKIFPDCMNFSPNKNYC